MACCDAVEIRATMAAMKLLRFGSFEVYRPRERDEETFFVVARKALAPLNLPNPTDNPQVIERTLDAYYAHCNGVFDRALAGLASRGLVEFLLGQLATWLQIHHASMSNGLSLEEQQRFRRWGPESQLALQFAVEGAAKKHWIPESSSTRMASFEAALDRLMIAAEEMVHASALLTVSRNLFPGRCALTVSWVSGSLGFDVSPTDPEEDRRWRAFGHRGALRQPGTLAKLEEPAPISGVYDHYGPVFQSEHSLSLKDMIGVAAHADSSCKPGEDAFNVKFCLESQLYEATARNAQVATPKAQLVLSGLTLTKSLLEEEDRQLWRPKQQNRLLRRPFIHFGHAIGPHLSWHSASIDRSIPYLLQEFCFGRVPPEWATPNIQDEANAFQSFLDHEWEQTVANTLREYGMQSDLRVKNLLATDRTATRLPPDIGDVDVLAYDAARNAVCVIEVKRIQPTSVPSQFRDDSGKFFGRGAYIEKFLRKIRWARANLPAIAAHLSLKGIAGIGDAENLVLRGAIITKYESFAQVPSGGVSIISLRRLVEERLESGAWSIAVAPE
jgi:hypothetical protein